MAAATGHPQVVAAGLVFPEAPRWHEGRLWLSDIHRHQVIALREDGHQEVVVTADDRPSGLGFRPDGSLLVVGLLDRELLELRDGRLSPVANLADYGDKFANDMVTDGLGRCYIGVRSFGEPGQPTDVIVMVDTDNVPTVVASDVVTPNGLVVTQDAKTLIVAETYARRLTAFDIADDGSLSGRRLFATVEGEPDGICVDEDDAVWVALPQEFAAIRVSASGEVLNRVDVPDRWVFSCALGGEDRRTLYLVAGKSTMANFERLGLDRSLDETSESRGWVLTHRVSVAGAGWP